MASGRGEEAWGTLPCTLHAVSERFNVCACWLHHSGWSITAKQPLPSPPPSSHCLQPPATTCNHLQPPATSSPGCYALPTSPRCCPPLCPLTQLLSLINGFNVNWPSTISNLMNFASVLAFEPDCVQPQCMDKDWNFQNNLIFQVGATKQWQQQH